MSPQEVIHQRAMIAIGIFIAITLAVVTFARVTSMGLHYEPASVEPVAMVELRFEDGADGLVTVYNADTGAELAAYGMDEGVFVRSVMRGVARQRRLRGSESRDPVTLAEFPDGEMWLTDPTNEIEIFLGAFGPDNRDAFAALLYPQDQLAEAELAGGAQ
ncbi:photosynthetic complex assembly protein PuhC [Maricaulaceae bacterium NA33B04]|nr:photosynthetic complex assembly protein PuhC [Maricaulaceae bacterium NA33B04]